MYRAIFLYFLAIEIIGCATKSKPIENSNTVEIPTINFAVKNYHTHDNTLFTEGLIFYDGKLFESSGDTKSVIGISDLTTGKFEKKIELNNKVYFGEGITFLKGKLYQLTYKNQEGFIYDAKTFKQINKFKYSNLEGWGLTTDSTAIIMSDGTDKLTYFDENMTPIKTLSVTKNDQPQTNLNELEYINGYIYANIYTENIIVKINPNTGKVVGQLDLSSLVYEAKNQNQNADVLNGIAYNAITKKIYVTGKM
jgi:glutaminyl-peptide cyclotransferase